MHTSHTYTKKTFPNHLNSKEFVVGLIRIHSYTPQNLHFKEKYASTTYFQRWEADPEMVPEMAQKSVQPNIKVESICGHLFFEVLVLYRYLLRALLAPPRLFWTAFDLPKL